MGVKPWDPENCPRTGDSSAASQHTALRPGSRELAKWGVTAWTVNSLPLQSLDTQNAERSILKKSYVRIANEIIEYDSGPGSTLLIRRQLTIVGKNSPQNTRGHTPVQIWGRMGGGTDLSEGLRHRTLLQASSVVWSELLPVVICPKVFQDKNTASYRGLWFGFQHHGLSTARSEPARPQGSTWEKGNLLSGPLGSGRLGWIL